MQLALSLSCSSRLTQSMSNKRGSRSTHTQAKKNAGEGARDPITDIVRSIHYQYGPEANLSAHHVLIAFGRLLERKLFDHRPYPGQHAELQCVFGIFRSA